MLRVRKALVLVSSGQTLPSHQDVRRNEAESGSLALISRPLRQPPRRFSTNSVEAELLQNFRTKI